MTTKREQFEQAISVLNELQAEHDEFEIGEDEGMDNYDARLKQLDTRIRAAEAEVERAEEEYLASDEPRMYRLCYGDGYEERVESTPAEIRDVIRERIREGDYDDVATTVWISCDYTDRRDPTALQWDSVRVALDPEEPECLDEAGHDWRSPHSIVGGIESNPGVWGHGGGVISSECCMRCGCKRTTDTWAQDRATGRQGLTSVSYDLGYYAERLSAQHEEG